MNHKRRYKKMGSPDFLGKGELCGPLIRGREQLLAERFAKPHL